MTTDTKALCERLRRMTHLDCALKAASLIERQAARIDELERNAMYIASRTDIDDWLRRMADESSDIWNERIQQIRRSFNETHARLARIDALLASDEVRRLEECAEKATPGPWNNYQCGVDSLHGSVCEAHTTKRADSNDTARYIAAANPYRVLRLLRALRDGDDNTATSEAPRRPRDRDGR